MRSFNRFYTRKIGVVQDRVLRSPFSLSEARVLYELGTRRGVVATGLSHDLDLDLGYLSRILRAFEKQRLIRKAPSPHDGRRHILSLTRAGRGAFKRIDTRSRQEIAKTLAGIPRREQKKLIDAMKTIERQLSEDGARKSPRIRLRRPRAGDMGWVVERHGEIYAREYGWDGRFEGLVAQIVGDFLCKVDPERERCWIADLNGRRVGSVFLVRKSQRVAKLRLLLVEPDARGYGIGTRLVNQCLVFARNAGYRKVFLWTNDVLHAARRIYERAGFKLVDEKRHEQFGRGLVGQTWEINPLRKDQPRRTSRRD